MDIKAVDTAFWFVSRGEEFLQHTDAEKLMGKGFDHYIYGLEDLVGKLVESGRLPKNATGDELSSQFAMSYITHHWRQYKAMYHFDPAFLNTLLQTEDAPVYPDILKRMPYPDFIMNLPQDYEYDHAFIHVEFDSTHGTQDTDTLFLVIPFCKQRSGDNIQVAQCMHWCRNGQKLIESFRNANEAVRKSEKGEKSEGNVSAAPLYSGNDNRMTAEELERFSAQNSRMEKYLRAAITAAYYLASKNAEIKETKTKKNERPMVATRPGAKPQKVNIKNYDVGYIIGQSFEKQMAGHQSNRETMTMRGGSTRAVRPHIRRAHWHHYWVGEGRTRREVRWIEPTMVLPGAKSEPVVATIRRVQGA